MSSEYLIDLCRRACVHADRTIDELDLAAPGQVAHWPQERRDTTLGALLARMVAETAQHAGHADIVRETIDGRGSDDTTADAEERKRYVTRIRAAADTFASADAPDSAQSVRVTKSDGITVNDATSFS